MFSRTLWRINFITFESKFFLCTIYEQKNDYMGAEIYTFQVEDKHIFSSVLRFFFSYIKNGIIFKIVYRYTSSVRVYSYLNLAIFPDVSLIDKNKCLNICLKL